MLSEREVRSLFFRLPKLSVQIIGMVTLTLISVFFFPTIEVGSIIAAVSVFLIPTILSVFILPFFKLFNCGMNYRQSGIIALISLTSTVITFMLVVILNIPIDQAIMLAIAFPISFRFLSNTGNFQHDPKKSYMPSILQSLLPIPFFQIFYDLNIRNISAYLITIFIGSIIVLILIKYINRPFEKDLGTPTMKVGNMIIKSVNGDLEGRKELEEFFSNNSIEGDIEYKFFSFRKKKDKQDKALFVLPGFHPGPLKGVGGSRLPEILSKNIKEYPYVFTFHSPSNHSINPVREKDCEILVNSIKKDFDDLKYHKKASKYIQKNEGGIVGAQCFGDNVLTSLSFYPEPAEDIHASVDKIISLKGESLGIKNIGVIDSHNCGTRRVSNVFYPSKKARRIIKKSFKVLKDIKTLDKHDLRLGISTKKEYKNSGIADEGVKVALLEVEDQLNCQILIDGNNMAPGFRGKIIEGIDDLVDVAEVHTSDTHEVNTLFRSHYPLGEDVSDHKLVKDLRKLIEEAKKDLEPVEVAAETDTIKDIELMGTINTERMNAIAETMLKTLPYAIIISFSFQLILTLLIFSTFW